MNNIIKEKAQNADLVMVMDGCKNDVGKVRSIFHRSISFQLILGNLCCNPSLKIFLKTHFCLLHPNYIKITAPHYLNHLLEL